LSFHYISSWERLDDHYEGHITLECNLSVPQTAKAQASDAKSGPYICNRFRDSVKVGCETSSFSGRCSLALWMVEYGPHILTPEKWCHFRGEYHSPGFSENRKTNRPETENKSGTLWDFDVVVSSVFIGNIVPGCL
jgi:hypothetical protein